MCTFFSGARNCYLYIPFTRSRLDFACIHGDGEDKDQVIRHVTEDERAIQLGNTCNMPLIYQVMESGGVLYMQDCEFMDDYTWLLHCIEVTRRL